MTALTLLPFQAADIAKLGRYDYTGLIVAEVGAGKTLTAVEAARAAGVETVLVIAPKGTHTRPWLSTVHGQGLDMPAQRIDGSPRGQTVMNALEWGEPGFYVITPELFRQRDFSRTRPDLTILDEAHMMIGPEGRKALRALRTGARIAMSGTPVRNKVENFYPLLRWLYPGLDQPGQLADVSEERWVTNYMLTEYDRFAPTNRRVVGEKEPGRIAREIPCYIQHFKREHCCPFHPAGFLAELPEPERRVDTVPLTAEQRRLIDRMEDTYVAWLEQQAAEAGGEGSRRAVVAKLPIAAQMRLRQMTLGVPSFVQKGTDEAGQPVYEIGFAPDCDSPKFDRLVHWIRTLGEPVVATTTSQRFAEMAVVRLNGLGIRAFEWSSKNSQVKRDRALESFIAGGLDVIVGVTEAVGTGIDGLQDAAGVLIRLEMSRDLTSEIQLEGRLDRRGQRRERVLVIDILAEGSMDQGVLSRSLEKRLALNKSLRKQQASAEWKRRRGLAA